MIVKIFDKFVDLPLLRWNPQSGVWQTRNDKKFILPDDSSVVDAYRERFQLAKERIKRRGFWWTDTSDDAIYPVECALGHDGERTLLGFMFLNEDGDWVLSDGHQNLKIDIGLSKFDGPFLFEGNLVLATGALQNGTIFKVAKIFGPPPSVNTALPPPSDSKDTDNPRTILFFSCCEFGSPVVISNLSSILKQFDGDPFRPDSQSSSPPTLIVFFGSFGISSGRVDALSYIEEFRGISREIGKLLVTVPNICRHSKLIFTAGPADLGPQCYPQPALLTIIQEMLEVALREGNVAASWRCVSNPFEAMYASRRIVGFRYNLFQDFKAAKNYIALPNIPTNEDDIASEIFRSISSQAHLLPHISARPSQKIIWPLDSLMRLDPLPDMIVFADSTLSSYAYLSKFGTWLANPGTIARKEWVMYNVTCNVVDAYTDDA